MTTNLGVRFRGERSEQTFQRWRAPDGSNHSSEAAVDVTELLRDNIGQNPLCSERRRGTHSLRTCQRLPNERELLVKEALHQRKSVVRSLETQLGSAEVRNDAEGVCRGVHESSRRCEREDLSLRPSSIESQGGLTLIAVS